MPSGTQPEGLCIRRTRLRHDTDAIPAAYRLLRAVTPFRVFEQAVTQTDGTEPGSSVSPRLHLRTLLPAVSDQAGTDHRGRDDFDLAHTR